MPTESLEREKCIWGVILLLGSMVLVHQVARGVVSPDHQVEPVATPQIVSATVVPPQEAPVVIPMPTPRIRDGRSSELLVEAIIMIESAGNPRCVGSKGERGLMQIKRQTWKETTRAWFGKSISFEKAFDPEWNRFVGRAYLAGLQRFLRDNQDKWLSDERDMLLASYNAGPKALLNVDFDITRLSSMTRSYVERGAALHNDLIEKALIEEPLVELSESEPSAPESKQTRDS